MKKVLITGAANGLGRALTGEFADGGWQVIAADIDDTNLFSLQQPGKVHCLHMDVTSDTSVRSAAAEIGDRFAPLDLVINNAGIDRYFPFSETMTDAFKAVFEINLFGVYRVNLAMIPHLRAPGGKIFHLGSESHHLTIPFMPYPLTKSALEAYSKVLRQELCGKGINVVLIRCGAMKTRLVDNLSGIPERPEGKEIEDPSLQQAYRRFIAKVPSEVGRVIPPRQAARLLYRIAGTAHPKHLYKINNSWRLKLARLVPFSLLETIIRRKLRQK